MKQPKPVTIEKLWERVEVIVGYHAPETKAECMDGVKFIVEQMLEIARKEGTDAE